MFTKFVTWPVIYLTLVAACANTDNGTKKVWNDALGKTNKPAMAEWTVADLAGQWSIACAPSQFLQNPDYRSASLQIAADSTFSYKGSEFSDAKCTAGLYQEQSRGTVQVNDAVDAFRKSVQFSFASGTGTPQSPDYVQFLNVLKPCGSEHWAVNQTRDLNTSACLGWAHHDVTSLGLSSDPSGKQQLQLFGNEGAFSGNTFTKE